MMLIFGLKLLLLQTAACLEFYCWFIQADPCYAALGHKLNLQMDTSEYRLKLIKRINNNQDDPVCRVKNEKIKDCNLFNNGTEVTIINGFLIINRVIRADSGNYTLRLEDSDGTETSADLQVIVEAPIGSVNVSISCSSNGMKSVSCSSDGDQLIYSWTLNGESLMDGNTTIELNETVGNIICSVKNHVSDGQKSIRVKHCPGSTTAAVTTSLTSSLTSTLTSSTQTSDHESVVFVLVWSFQMMVLFGLLGGFHIYMRHTSGKKQEVRMRRFREGHEHTAEDS
ncbi:hypothetical protein DPX16_14320 [Anabarilius grahami]|uniref:Ig-like domain-containing protein n=1 Tax=Anabarilius grahami TaxID=495550 RepID=A0A3N0XM14_ANAGA|nr:hypothetical protein DPX16_14320 [Anabarilius grahami]